MADSKLTALSELSVPAVEDLLYVVDDPSGTATSNKLTLQRLLGLGLSAVCQGGLMSLLLLESGGDDNLLLETSENLLLQVPLIFPPWPRRYRTITRRER